MLRITAAALCLIATSTLADNSRGFQHTHQDGYTGSFSNPINYRPNRTPGVVVVRVPGYTEANTLRIRGGRPGVTTGTSVAPPQGVTGQNLAGLELQPLDGD